MSIHGGGAAARTRVARLPGDLTNYLRFEFWNVGGNQVRAFRVIGGTGSCAPGVGVVSIALGASNSLRVTKSGDTFTLEYKIDSGPWTPAGSFTQPGFTVTQAGVFVNNANTGPYLPPTTTGKFDFFSATAVP